MLTDFLLIFFSSCCFMLAGGLMGIHWERKRDDYPWPGVIDFESNTVVG